jgi:hypothetical protein
MIELIVRLAGEQLAEIAQRIADIQVILDIPGTALA